jgi:hypothetical protein
MYQRSDAEILIPPYPREGYRYTAEGIFFGLIMAAMCFLIPAFVVGAKLWPH